MKYLISTLFLSLALSGCGGGSSGDDAGETPNYSQPDTETEAPETEQIEHLSAGDATVEIADSNAFSEHSANLTDPDKVVSFTLGNDFFENPWVAGSASTSSRDGLGGHFNNNACQDCHVRDGRGHAPNVSETEDGTDFSTLLIRASRTLLSDEELLQIANLERANVPDTSVGGQLQHDAIASVQIEAALRVSYEPVTVTFADATQVELRKPIWHLTSLYADQGYDFNADTVFSARQAQSMSGLGLLALIPEQDLLAHEDPSDSDGDGISGRANYVWSLEQEGITLGRFGWKAGQPSLIEQAAGAFLNDMGLTSRLHPEESCMPHQLDCLAAPTGNGDINNQYDYEVSDRILDAIAFYSAHLAVPARRNAYGAQVKAGKALFNEAGCSGCHVAEYTTGYDAGFPELSNQTIFPYTDLLLHDMGEALADFTLSNEPAGAEHQVEFLATSQEWRTPPLWGIGLAKTVDPEATFLHDGRARTILEAVLWHGGEAESAKQAVLNMSAKERERLLAFLNDL